MKNKEIRNRIRNRRDNAAETRGNIRNKRARTMVMTLCAALALGQAGIGISARAADSGKTGQETQTAEEDISVEMRKLFSGRVEPMNLLLAAKTGMQGEKEDTGNKGAASGEEGDADSAEGTKESGSTGTDTGAKDTGSAGEEPAVSKEETVYVLTAADGSVQKIIVSDWIKNTLGNQTIKDISELEKLESVKDELDYTTGESNEKIWNADGGDIYYQGNIEKDLPVAVKVTYLLDGKEISPRELAGKSGKVTIRFDYTNTRYEEVEIDGEKTKIYVPFAMMTGMILDNEVFTNVEVTNGRLMNDGDRTVVTGLAFPGLQESLDVDSEKMEIPDYVEVTADVKGFQLGMTATVASNDVFSGINLEKEDALEDLNGSMEELTDAMEQLMDGSSQLYEGLCTLLDKSGELIKGIDQLAAGSAELRNGAGSLNEGAAKLQDGAARLQNGLNTLTSKNGELTGGARQVFETLLSTARTQLTAAGLEVPELTIENYGEVLTKTIASLDADAVYQQALNQVTNAVEEKRPFIEAQVTDAVREEVAAKVEAAVREQVTAKVTEAAGEQVAAAVTEAVREQVTAEVTKAAKAQVTAAVTEAVRAAVTEEVETVGKAEITNQVTAAVLEEVTRQVTEEVRNQVTNGVTEEIRRAVTEQVIQAVTKMDSAAYEEAVAAGTIDARTQAAVEAGIAEQMKSDTVKAQINTNTETQMETEEVKARITANTEAQMSGNAIKAQIEAKVKSVIEAKVEEQMGGDEIKATIQANIDEQMQSLVPAKVEEQMVSDEIKATIQANIDQQMQSLVPAKVEEQMVSDEIKTVIQTNIDAQMNSEALKDTVAANTELQVQKAITENMAGEEVQSKLAAASEGAKSVIALKASLDNYNVFYLGLQTYTAGVAEAASGAGSLSAGIGELKSGASRLSDGSAQLYDGIQIMRTSAPALTDGITRLRDGALELTDGLNRFNEEGIGRLADAVEGDLQGLTNRLRAMSDVSRNYKSFAGIGEEMEGSVKFIYRTEAVETGDER